MFRHLSTLLTPALSLCFLLSASSASAQAAPAHPSSPVEVLYVANDEAVFTYDVDSQTGTPKLEGETIVVPSNPNVTPSANDHYIYVIGNNPGSNAEQIFTYSTNANGTPDSNYLQQITLTDYTYNFMIDPNGTLAYAVQSSQNSQGEILAGILLFHVNPETGLLGGPTVVATYPANGPCGSGMSGSYSLLGFNPSGTILYDEWLCTGGAGSDATYSTRDVNQQTGALGPDVSTFYWDLTPEESASVNFTPNALIFFLINGYGQNLNSAEVYPPSGASSPTFTCTAAMLAACGDALSDAIDPSGDYIFFQIGADTTDVAKLELSEKRIVNTGSHFTGLVKAFSPDDKLVYAEIADQYRPYLLPIYVFDLATGAITNDGGEIELQVPGFQIAPAVRN
jgi:hypothetical protein